MIGGGIETEQTRLASIEDTQPVDSDNVQALLVFTRVADGISDKKLNKEDAEKELSHLSINQLLFLLKNHQSKAIQETVLSFRDIEAIDKELLLEALLTATGIDSGQPSQIALTS